LIVYIILMYFIKTWPNTFNSDSARRVWDIT